MSSLQPPPDPKTVEAARKWAVRASHIAHHHFRLLKALNDAAVYARSVGNPDDALILEDNYQSIDAFSRHVRSDADNAHAHWDGLRRAAPSS
ncbi:hypothetical protein [Mycobacterium sp.]|uniref:hypothetical protein n=1 Tax=Mycobacterium sp. TaxID=1785 RepID=UPI003F9E5088